MELATTLDWRDYVDPDALRRELETCFAGAWHYVGHARGLDVPGAQRAERALDVPVLLVRDADPDDREQPGELRLAARLAEMDLRHRGPDLAHRVVGILHRTTDR